MAKINNVLLFYSMIKLKKIIFFVFLLLSQWTMGQMPYYKSLYIYHFIKRIEWPEITGQSQFIIAVVGDKDTYEALLLISKDKKVSNLPLKVVYSEDATDLHTVNLIYVDYSMRKSLKHLSNNISQKPILLVSDDKDSPLVDICLIERSEELNFIVHPKKIRLKGLKINTDLVQLGIQKE